MPVAEHRRWARIASAVAIGVLAALAGCGPSPLPPGALVVLTGLTITGPAQIEPGVPSPFTAIATYSDGSWWDKTPQATWGCCSALRFNTPGVATGTYPGDFLINATYQESSGTGQVRRVSATSSVLVLEPGTFKVSGRVLETGGAVPSGVSVRVVSGNLQGNVSGGFNGQYAFYGAVGPIQLEATAANHVSQRRDLVVTANTVVDDFVLPPVVNPDDVSGAWTLTLVEPAPSCPAGFPPAARNRAYTMSVTQQGTQLRPNLSRPGAVVVFPEYFSGLVNANQVSLSFPYENDDFTGRPIPNIVDLLTPTSTLSFGITITGTNAGSEIVSTTSGTILYWTGPTTAVPTWQCFAENHIFTVRR